MKRSWIALAVLLLVVISMLSRLAYIEFAWLLQAPPSEGNDVAVHIENRTNQQIGPFTIVTSSSETSLALPTIAPGQIVTAQFTDASTRGENSMSLVDRTGGSYWLVGYFEWPLSGDIDVRVDSVTSDGALQGRSRARISWPGPWRWYPLASANSEQ